MAIYNIPSKCITRYLAAAICVGGKYLVLISSDPKIAATHGFFFPGAAADPNIDDRVQLQQQLFLKYRISGFTGEFVGDVLVKISNSKYASLNMYQFNIDRNKQIQLANTKMVFVSPSDFAKTHFSQDDGMLADRLFIFNRLYDKTYVKATLNAKERQVAVAQYKVLLYFQNKITNKDLMDYVALFKAGATLKELFAAYEWICNRSEISERDVKIALPLIKQQYEK